MSNLTILNTAVRQFDNLYSLNDLHEISGGESKHRPNQFARLDTTKDLIAEIQKEDPNKPVLVRKNGIGTYAVKEIVIAYAAWISPAFHLTVLRAFLNQVENAPRQMALPEPEPRYSTTFSAQEISRLVWLLFSHEQMRGLLEQMHPALEAIGSKYSAAVYGNYTEYKRHYRDCLPIIKSLVAYLKADRPREWEALNARLRNF